MNKDVEQHLDELIDYYSKCDFNDAEYLKKLIVRNLKDVKRRYIKYDKPRRNIIEEIESIVYADIPNIDVRINIQEALDRFNGE